MKKEWLSRNTKATPRAEYSIHRHKKRDNDGVVYWELLPRDVVTAVDVSWQQLRRFAAASQGKRLGRLHQVLLQHNNARPHSAGRTKAVTQDQELG